MSDPERRFHDPTQGNDHGVKADELLKDHV